MIETTLKKRFDTLKKLRKDLDSVLTDEQKDAIDFAILAIQIRQTVFASVKIAIALLKIFLIP